MKTGSDRLSVVLAFCLVLLLFPAFPLQAQTATTVQPEAEVRSALVIGNGAYTASPLTNTVNDALDVATALGSMDFSVLVRTNLDLAGMDAAVDAWLAGLTSGQTALFYYAGHGVQVQGENYLIPVHESITSEAAVRSKSLGLSDLLERASKRGIATLLVFLDSCRDNPFPGSSRTGVRGLSVVSAPTGNGATNSLETLIAYATEPGETAKDGIGRNGYFTEAFLEELRVEGRSLADMMAAVRAKVMERTTNVQRPRYDSGLVKPFYFMDSASRRAKNAAELARLTQELEELRIRGEALDSQKQGAKTAVEKSTLEIEQKRQAVVAEAKRQELARAKEDEERLRQEAVRVKAEREARNAYIDAEALRIAQLRKEAERRRQEFETSAMAEKSIDAYLVRLAALDLALKDIGTRYAESTAAMEANLGKLYASRFAALSGMTVDPWETDAMFRIRVDQERSNLDVERSRELVSRRSVLAAEQTEAEKDLRRNRSETESALLASMWTVRGIQVKLTYGSYDRNAQLWPMTMKSEDPSFRYSVSFNRDLRNVPNLRDAYMAIQREIDTGSGSGEIEYVAVRSGNSFILRVLEIRIVDLVTGSILYRQREKLPEPTGYRVTASGIAIGYRVFYEGNGNTGGSLVDEKSYFSGDFFMVPGAGSLVKTGYGFMGWNTAADGQGETMLPGSKVTVRNSDIRLYAQWNPLYRIVFDPNGHTGGTVPVDASMYTTGAVATLPGAGSLVKTGYGFMGWNTAADGQGETMLPGSRVTVRNSDIRLYAQWNPLYRIVFDPNGHTGGTVPVDTWGYRPGDIVILPQAGSLYRTDYRFLGWNRTADGGGERLRAGDRFVIGNADVRLYAHWDPLYRVIFDPNGYTGGSVPVDSSGYSAGESVTLPGADSLIRTGYKFVGWNTAPDGYGAMRLPGSKIVLGRENLRLYAQWQKDLVEMLPVPGGSFTMGSSIGYLDEQPAHRVIISSFLMSKYEVTQAQYRTVMGTDPSTFSSGVDEERWPVENVTWYDAVEFCNKLSGREGYEPVYTILGRMPATRYPITSAMVTMNLRKNGYRLPTEAEWEYAARGGSRSPEDYAYSGSNDVGNVAWFLSNSRRKTQPVGTRAPNDLGLCDMSGNVWEWCQDWYASYSSAAQNDPSGPYSGTKIVRRGGGWYSGAVYCRSAYRDSDSPGRQDHGIGFRIVRRP